MFSPGDLCRISDVYNIVSHSPHFWHNDENFEFIATGMGIFRASGLVFLIEERVLKDGDVLQHIWYVSTSGGCGWVLSANLTLENSMKSATK